MIVPSLIADVFEILEKTSRSLWRDVCVSGGVAKDSKTVKESPTIPVEIGITEASRSAWVIVPVLGVVLVVSLLQLKREIEKRTKNNMGIIVIGFIVLYENKGKKSSYS